MLFKVKDSKKTNVVPPSSPTGSRVALCQEIVRALKRGDSLFVTGSAGLGKSFVCEQVIRLLKSELLPVARLSPGTAKEILVGMAEDFGIDPNDENDKPMSVPALRNEIADHLKTRSCFIICDNLPQIPISLRLWLDTLYTKGQTIFATGKSKPEKDLIFKLVEYGLEPLEDSEIKRIISSESKKVGLKADLKNLVQNSSGNPGIAIKLVKESNIRNKGINIKSDEPEHQNWFALDKWIVLAIAAFALLRYAGKDPLLFVGGSAMIFSRIGSQIIRYTPKKG